MRGAGAESKQVRKAWERFLRSSGKDKEVGLRVFLCFLASLAFFGLSISTEDRTKRAE